MADYRNPQMSAGAGVRTAEIDEGLRAHMNKVYGLMSLAMVVTAGIAYTIGTSNAALETIFTNTPLLYAIMFGPLALVLVLTRKWVWKLLKNLWMKLLAICRAAIWCSSLLVWAVERVLVRLL